MLQDVIRFYVYSYIYSLRFFKNIDLFDKPWAIVDSFGCII